MPAFAQALKILAEKDVGALVITKKGRLCGIFSERDFARIFAVENDFPLDTPISKVMTSDVLTVTPADSIENCMQLMTDPIIFATCPVLSEWGIGRYYIHRRCRKEHYFQPEIIH